MTRKNADYWAGYHEEAARNGRSGSSFTELAERVTAALGRDNGRKTRILQRSPRVFAAMDAEEVSRASSYELAARELAELGIDAGDCDPVQLLDAHHAGRQWARDNMMSGGRRRGGAAQDSAVRSFVDRFLHNGEDSQ